MSVCWSLHSVTVLRHACLSTDLLSKVCLSVFCPLSTGLLSLPLHFASRTPSSEGWSSSPRWPYLVRVAMDTWQNSCTKNSACEITVSHRPMASASKNCGKWARSFTNPAPWSTQWDGPLWVSLILQAVSLLVSCSFDCLLEAVSSSCLCTRSLTARICGWVGVCDTVFVWCCFLSCQV